MLSIFRFLTITTNTFMCICIRYDLESYKISCVIERSRSYFKNHIYATILLMKYIILSPSPNFFSLYNKRSCGTMPYAFLKSRKHNIVSYPEVTCVFQAPGLIWESFEKSHQLNYLSAFVTQTSKGKAQPQTLAQG